ncbi:tRNA(fMet)-specific endonuclease VapC [Planktothrix serta PCC 8927]|uniref:Ribonuclease VapC n=1 Tax=Planktothrix serta PCC 8927 TaxID=671068 RepID=A0A7Z9E546_9CYAN|nr:type II toxin-antitoxin system VapC family toxin [Planktothrix serta]VXD23822.1 tRNA(fMet)-specific endonuclease VapC [Planktothrix serta PCC 8927]
MSYLLDTNVCIQLLNNSNPSVTRRLALQQPGDIYLCTVVQFELYYGAYKSSQPERNLAILQRFFKQFNILSLNKKAAKIAGEIRAQLAALGTPIGPYDVQIAAIALANKLVLVTHNTAEFSRVPNLQIEDWEL